MLPPFGTHKTDYNPSNKSILFDSFKKSPCISIILSNGGGDVGVSCIAKFKTLHPNQTFILDMTERIDSLKKRAKEMYSRKWIFVDVDSTPKKKIGQMYNLCEKLNCLCPKGLTQSI